MEKVVEVRIAYIYAAIHTSFGVRLALATFHPHLQEAKHILGIGHQLALFFVVVCVNKVFFERAQPVNG